MEAILVFSSHLQSFTPLISAAFSICFFHSPQFPFTEIVVVKIVDCALIFNDRNKPIISNVNVLMVLNLNFLIIVHALWHATRIRQEV